MKTIRLTFVAVCAFLASVTLLGCGNKESADAGASTTNAPAKAGGAMTSAPPAAQQAAQRGMAQGQADGNAYAQRMKAQAGQAPK